MTAQGTAAATRIAHQYSGNLTRMMLTAAGDQEASTSTLLHTPDGTPRITVLTGSVLTYCTSYAAVAAHAEAWTEALTVAERLQLPTFARLYDLPADVRAKFTAYLSQTVQGNPSWSVNPYAPSADPGRMASVWVRVGQLTIRALDIRAIDSISTVWTASLPLAAALYDDVPQFPQ